MFKNLSMQCHVFYRLLERDLKVFAQNAIDNYINTLCWVLLCLLVYQFIMPELGWIHKGEFLLVNCVISKSFFGIMDNVTATVADLEGNKSISYDMTLPISHTMLFIKIAISNTIYAFSLALMIIPAGKLLLWNYISFPFFSFPKFIVIMIISSLLAGFFSLFIIAITKTVTQIEDVWGGIIFPMFCLGGFEFTWKNMYSISPTLAYLDLCNPLVFMFEGIRAATLDPTLSLPYSYCILALIVFTIPMGSIGIYLLKKRLDAI
jgi:ABC-2 type transport system permease protein